MGGEGDSLREARAVEEAMRAAAAVKHDTKYIDYTLTAVCVGVDLVDGIH